MSLKITNPEIRDQIVLEGDLDRAGSPWAGMSGAVVVTADDLVVGVVRGHSPAEGTGSLTATRLEAIASLPGDVARVFLTALQMTDPREWPRVPLSLEDSLGLPLVSGQVVVGEIPREPPAFVARETLARLAAAVWRGPAVVCAVTGLRGVGKTQVAAAYARARVGEGWGLVGWVNAETRDTLLNGLARVADQLGVGDPEGDSLKSARLLRDHLLTRTGEGLLVFDNATDPDGVRPFLPATGGTQVVITTTDRAFTEIGEAVDVTAFSRPESLRYLRERTGLADEAGAAEVARELGDLPLGLAQAAATIGRRHLTYPKYLERLRRVPVQALLGRVPGGDYPHSTAAALLMSIQATEASDPTGLTGRLLRILAVLSADGVRRDILGGLTSGGSNGGEDDVDAALERCVAGSLLVWSVTGDAVIMHRLSGRVLRERDQANGQWADTVTAALDLLEPRFIPQEQAWARREEGAHLVTQAEALAEACAMTGAGTADLCERELRARSWAVRQLQAATDLSRAIDLGAQTLADSERMLGGDHPRTATARNNLAIAYWSAGRLEQAIPLFERAAADFERVLGDDDHVTINSRRNLAYAYQSAGRLELAIAMYERAVDDCERVLGDDHPDTVACRDNLARAYWSAGQLEQAVALYERAVADSEQILGADHPHTLASRNNLAAAYQSAGQLELAVALYERTLADRERVLGTDHPDTLTARNNLAAAYEEAGRLEQAVLLYERALADRERVLGTDHPDTLTARNNLAAAYQSAGRLELAIPLSERAVTDCERVLSVDHPMTLTSRGNLANAYLSAGQLERAIPLLERTLADCERVLGDDHPDTLGCQDILARAYKSAGWLEQAIPLYERTLADRERVLGADHPHTLSTQADLATAYWSAGRLERAIPLLERTLADYERVLGDDHPHTITARNNLANVYMSAGRQAMAIPLVERALADCARVLGDDHPHTITARNNLANAYRTVDRLEQAIPLHEQALADCERVLGADHPQTLSTRHSLANAYRSAGRLEQAIPLYERALAGRERVLGANHPDTLTSRRNLQRARIEAHPS
jgi:tetratricopeptide (TPR) repeat protein